MIISDIRLGIVLRRAKDDRLGEALPILEPLLERQQWADCTVSFQIDAAEARRMDMRPD